MGESGKAEAGTGRLGTVVVLNVDLMFGVRIGNGLRGLGYRVVFARDGRGFSELVRERSPAPVLGVIDMNAGIDWSVIGELATDRDVTTPLLAFGPHVDIDGRRAAKAAGVDRIVSNGEFHRSMVELVGRYALPPAGEEAAE